MTYLGVRPGAVTPFAVINDKEDAGTMVLDSGVMGDDPGARFVNCHPLVNTMTTALEPEDLVRFLEPERHAPLLLAFYPASNTLNGRADLPSDPKAPLYPVHPPGPRRRGPRATARQHSTRHTDANYGTNHWGPGWPG